MSAVLSPSPSFDVADLARAVAANESNDSLTCRLSAVQWATLGAYLQPFPMWAGQALITQGAQDRTVYLIESGTLSVHYEDTKGRVRLAMVAPGFGGRRGRLFHTQPPQCNRPGCQRRARIWSLTPLRFTELANRQPALALELVMGLGAVVSRRLANRPKRIAVT
jgi:CRP/FNR family cyclic AMP-dependent transcriptional regulator